MNVSKDKAISKIINQIDKINKENGLKLEFLGFKEDIWKNRFSIILIKCNIHNITFEITYKNFMYNKGKLICPECFKEAVGDRRRKYNTEDEIISVINCQIKKLNSEGWDLEFIGFKNHSNKTVTNYIYIKCRKHDTVKCMSINDFIKRHRFACNQCAKENRNHHPNLLTNKEIYHKLVDKFGDYYDFSPILKEEELGLLKGDRIISFICPKHGEKKMRIANLIRKMKINIPCKDCSKEYYRKQNEQLCITHIKDAIKQRNRIYGFDYEFVKFEQEFINLENSVAIIKCKTHNTTWKVNAGSFISGNTISNCSDCIKRYKYEEACYNILKNLGIEDLERRYSIKCFDPILNKDRTLFIDIYSKSLNKAFEYDGPQHYDNTPWFYDTVEEYKDQIKRDKLKDEYCRNNNISLLRITYKDNNRLEEVIKAFIEDDKDIAKKIIPKEYPD